MRRSLLAAPALAALISLAPEARAISRCDVIADAESWVVAGVPYSQGKWGSYCQSDSCYADPLRPGPACWRSDCSGFVSATWNVSTGNTYSGRTTLGYAPFDTSVSYAIGSMQELLPGDALNSEGHIMLFGGWTGPDTFFAYEETTCYADVGITTAHKTDYALGSSYIQKFTPIRFVDIEPCNAPPVGHVDAAGCEWVAGWAQDPDALNAPLDVHLYFDGPAGSGASAIAVRADVHRDDLCAAIGSCQHGFQLRTPPRLRDGKPHTVFAYAIDTAGGANPLLVGSPATFTCDPVALPLPPERAVRRWVSDPATFDAWRFSSLDVVDVAPGMLADYREGAAIAGPPKLLRQQGTTLVYLVDDGKKRQVLSGSVVNAWRFNAIGFEEATEQQLAALPDGPPVLPASTLVRGEGSSVMLLDERPDGGVWLPAEESASYDGAASSDVDGNGTADACARTPSGFACHLTGTGQVVSGPALSDAEGWGEPSRWSTLRMADVTGDGKADVCARAAEGLRCWPSTGTGFAADPIVGPELSDAGGWAAPRYHGTLRLLDYTGDGRADVCARAAAGLRCWPSTGTGFGPGAEGPELSDATGWADESNWATIVTGDVDGDGRHDLCARADARVFCWLSDGKAPSLPVEGPELSDAKGHGAQSLWATLRLADVDGDGRMDLCSRTPDGFRCWPSTGKGFGAPIEGPALTDAAGWGDHANWSTLRMADVTGDGLDDLCARADAGLLCWPSTGKGFGTPIEGPALADAAGWGAGQHFRTVRLADVDADGRADVCARSVDGVRCWLSDGKGFSKAYDGPAWSNAAGFERVAAFATLRLVGGKKPASTGQGAGGAATGGGAGNAGGGKPAPGAAGQGGVSGGAAVQSLAARDDEQTSSGCHSSSYPVRSGHCWAWCVGGVAAVVARRTRARVATRVR